MSAANPQSAESLRALARKSRTGSLSRNEAWELEQAMKQTGQLGRELKRIIDGNA